jgi:lipoyl(octanoyl) transferase
MAAEKAAVKVVVKGVVKSTEMENKCNTLIVKSLGLVGYRTCWEQMKSFVDSRDESTQDEIWILEHPPVFTLGQAASEDHLLAPGDIEIVQSDRGGQVTYHGPGQLVIYLLLDLRRRQLGPRALVTIIEESIVKLLSEYDLPAETKAKAPGVYVNGRKIASLGLRIRRGFSFHGLSLNIDMDLEPFSRINPCGYEGLEVTQLSDLGVKEPLPVIAKRLCALVSEAIGYTQVQE